MGDHTEACQVDFDPRQVTYKQMLDLVWGMHDPYRNKSSRQYRNAVWYHNDEQKKILLDQVAKMNNPSSGGIHRPVATAIEPLGEFWRAEEYHQQYNSKARGGRRR